MKGLIMMTEQECQDFFLKYFPVVKKIIFNKITTILIFKNGEKSVVQWDGNQDDFYFDREKAILYAYAKYKIKCFKDTKCFIKNITNICVKEKLKSQFVTGGIRSKSVGELVLNQDQLEKLSKNIKNLNIKINL